MIYKLITSKHIFKIITVKHICNKITGTKLVKKIGEFYLFKCHNLQFQYEILELSNSLDFRKRFCYLKVLTHRYADCAGP